MNEESKHVNRRGFLYGAGASALGLAAMGTLGCWAANQPKPESAAKAEANFPLKYVKLDPVKAMDRTYQGYLKGG